MFVALQASQYCKL